MKIKCPIPKCKTSQWLEFANSTGLFRHLMNEHTNHEVSSYFARQQFKIHEKIEELETEIEKIKKQTNWKEGMYLDEFGKTTTIQELKSLLEK